LYYTIFSIKIQNKMKKYYIITYGCQMNENDSEKIAAKLEKKGYKQVKSIEQTDLVIINVCSIRQSAINRVYSKIKQLSKFKIILTGCILEKDKKIFKEQVDEIWPIVDLSANAKYKSTEKAFVPIMTGCDNFCAYCVVPYTRGREYSRPAHEIIKEVKELVKKGYKEIILLGQNVNSYQGQSLKLHPCPKDVILRTVLDFPTLLQLLNNIPGQFQLKFLTSHPKDMSDKLIQIIAQSNKISKEIHLPTQSGNNQILKKMNRGYTVGHYKKLIKKILCAMPKAKISTDIIVGFPGETKKQFEDTVKLVKEIGFKQTYVSAYSPRANTNAFKLKDDVPSDEKKRRKRIILGIISQGLSLINHA